LISIVVATRDMNREKEILANIGGCGDEVIIVEGRNPSLQRNEGVRLAGGGIIYFADDDSFILRPNFEKAKKLLEEQKDISVLGGPSLTPVTDTAMQKAFGAALASPWATGKSSARYRKAGGRRDTGEKELILCNLFVRKEVFNGIGNFREELYPNEENEFLNRAQAQGLKLVYDPDMYVERSQRKRYPDFMRQCFVYGRGRAEQMLLSFNNKDIINTVPAFFVVYILFIALTGASSAFELLPLIFYIPATVYFAFREGKAMGGPKAYLLLLLNLPLLHVMYGAGFIFGILRGIVVREKKADKRIQVKIIPKG
jgi:succinoglycan biosynthesis protein ExoA